MMSLWISLGDNCQTNILRLSIFGPWCLPHFFCLMLKHLGFHFWTLILHLIVPFLDHIINLTCLILRQERSLPMVSWVSGSTISQLSNFSSSNLSTTESCLDLVDPLVIYFVLSTYLSRKKFLERNIRNMKLSNDFGSSGRCTVFLSKKIFKSFQSDWLINNQEDKCIDFDSHILILHFY